jgi:hypothetical protein
MSEFEQAYLAFISHHEERRTGERRRRLLQGHGYGEKLLLEKVWWPLFGHFNDLHPEYEVLDWNRKSMFLDFAFIPAFGRFGVESDGYQSHIKDMDREKHNYAVNRETFLTGMGWRMLHFTVHDIQNRPDICKMLLNLSLAPYLLQPNPRISAMDKEILQLAWLLGRNIRPKDVRDQLHLNYRTAIRRIDSLVRQKLLSPIHNGHNIRHYQLTENALEKLL